MVNRTMMGQGKERGTQRASVKSYLMHRKSIGNDRDFYQGVGSPRYSAQGKRRQCLMGRRKGR
jgi:hypothetical protein